MTQTGTIQQIFGPVVDVAFEGDLPAINEAIVVDREDEDALVLEVAQQLGDATVRCVAMASTDGLRRGTPARATASTWR